MGPRALGVCRPSPRGAWPYRGIHRKSIEMGVKGVCSLGCLPLWGREGVTLANPLMAVWKGFL